MTDLLRFFFVLRDLEEWAFLHFLCLLAAVSLAYKLQFVTGCHQEEGQVYQNVDDSDSHVDIADLTTSLLSRNEVRKA